MNSGNKLFVSNDHLSMFENLPENLVHLNYVPNVPDSWYKLGTKSDTHSFFVYFRVLVASFKMGSKWSSNSKTFTDSKSISYELSNYIKHVMI